MGAAVITSLLAVAIRRRGVLAVVAAVLLASCGTVAPNRRAAEYLDESTGATITRVEEPLILFSDDPAHAANARDYIQAAPLAVNQAGKHSWWLWLGLWSTIDRGASPGGVQRADVAGILLLVDGEPMELDIGARAESIPGLGRLPYATPVATARNILLPLTASQVTRLSRASSVAIRTEMTGGGTLLWQPWTRSGSWQNFAELAAADPGPPP